MRLRVTEHGPGGDRAREDRVVTEEPLEIRLAEGGSPPRRVWVTMRTPGHDFELAAGFAVHEGLIAPSSLRRVAYCTDDDLSPEEEMNVVTVTVVQSTDTAAGAGPATSRARDLGALTSGSSACGVCGADSVASALAVPRSEAWDGPLPGIDVVRRLPERLRAAQRLFDRTGGLHAAALADATGELLVVREDVGRHNAVDKVTGARVLVGEPPAAACLLVSGRAGFELVQKAVVAGVGMMVAVGAPTSLSVRLAREHGLALVGFTSADRCVRYA